MKLNENFNKETFSDWVENFFPEFLKDERVVKIPEGFTSVKSIITVGESALGVRVFVIQTEKDPSDRKIGLAKESFHLIKNYGTPNALIAYYSNESSKWRLSLLTSTPEWSEGKIITKLSNPKRQSYVLGPQSKVNTPNRFLLNRDVVKDIADLKSRFSLEVVNKEFYKEISESFVKLVGGTLGTGRNQNKYNAILKLPFVADHSQTSIEFAVRLIGRIIFCWFLREKKSSDGTSLMPKELVSLEAIKNHSDYYHQVLEPIFFEVLNQPVKVRKDPFYDKPYSLIPYLNGGLFSPHKPDDFYERKNGDFQSRFHNTLVIPDGWFVELFKTLETYNFTIDENTSFDEELSIDPEMLGLIFENLLAEINPETGESARKSTGSYYTPRIIVDYMVDESLLLYLKQQTKIEESKLRAILSYDLTDDTQYPLDDTEKNYVIDALEKIKILDPACGSGAFPIGALQKMVFILQQIDLDGHLWFKKQIQNTSPEIRRVLEREFTHKNFDYIRKLGVIRENIYGIDIQPIATEISRLRCFLTLVVDERIDDSQENRGIEPLPNLDFKFVTANSLIGLPATGKQAQSGLFEDSEGISELKEIRDLFFNASGSERDVLKLQFVQSQNKMFQRLISEGRRGHADLTTKLTSWDPFSHTTSDWFDAEWMFGIKEGFDVIIGNPPYIKVQNIDKDLISQYKNNYTSAKGKFDIYVLFVEMVFNLNKSNGIASYIQPHRYLQASYGFALRNILKKIQGVHKIVNFGVDQIFGNVTTYTGIFFYKKNSPYINFSISRNTELSDLSFSKNQYTDLSDKSGWVLSEDISASRILNKIYQCRYNITDIFKGVFQGIVTVGDDIFIMQGELEKDLFNGFSKKLNKNVQIELSLMKPSLKGENIKRYQSPQSSYYVFYPHIVNENGKTVPIEPEEFQNKYPLAFTYISTFKEELVNKKKAYKTNPKYWYSLHRSRDINIFEPIKIITPQLQNHPCFTLDMNSKYPDAGGYCLVLKNPDKMNYLVYLAILNSKLLYYFITHTSTPFNNNYYYFKTDYLEPFGIPDISKEYKTRLAGLAEQIFDETVMDTKNIENNINQIVYELYGLTNDEIKIIEANYVWKK